MGNTKNTLDAHANKYGIILKEKLLKTKFAELIKTLGNAKGSVVVIIDEYDKPIVDLIDKLEQAELSRSELKNFYGTLKGADVDANMHFLFVTGVSKFSKVALFSDLNNLEDLTNDTRMAALVGYTDQEVNHYLTKHIEAFANSRHESYDQTRQVLKSWYNGYRFTKNSIKVYNPFSLHNCLVKKDLYNYWFTSGTPSFLIKFIEKNPLIASDDLGLFCKHLQDFIKLVLHNIRVEREKFYHQIFFMVCVLFGRRPPTEVAIQPSPCVATADTAEEGFMDLLLEGTECTFVVEFKQNSTPEIALEQIECKRYWEPYEILKTKKVVLAGITFNKTEAGTRVLWKIKELGQTVHI